MLSSGPFLTLYIESSILVCTIVYFISGGSVLRTFVTSSYHKDSLFPRKWNLFLFS